MSCFDSKAKMKETFDTWATPTFGQKFSEYKNTGNGNRQLIGLIELVLIDQNLMGRRMNGKCVEKLKSTKLEKLKINYSQTINKIELNSEFWTPFDVVRAVCQNNLDHKAFYVEKAKEYKMEFEELTIRMCGRALVAMPSIVREYQLHNVMPIRFPDAKFEKNVELDLKLHCDLKMTWNGVDYYFWSYLATEWGVQNFKEKFRGERGSLHNGVHVICPIERDDLITYQAWYLYPSEYIDRLCKIIRGQELINYEYALQKARVESETLCDNRFFLMPAAILKNS